MPAVACIRACLSFLFTSQHITRAAPLNRAHIGSKTRQQRHESLDAFPEALSVPESTLQTPRKPAPIAPCRRDHQASCVVPFNRQTARVGSPGLLARALSGV